MKKLIILSFSMIAMISSCKDEVLFDLDSQLTSDVAIIDQYLADNNISHESDNSGLRYEVLNFAQGQVLAERQVAFYEITMWKLDGTFYGSTNPDVDRSFGGDGTFSVYNRRDFGWPFSSKWNHYFPLVTPRMTLGDRYRVYVPSPYAFGFETDFLQRPIAPNTNLIVEIEMTEIVDY